jgi:hypothetical protein
MWRRDNELLTPSVTDGIVKNKSVYHGFPFKVVYLHYNNYGSKTIYN